MSSHKIVVGLGFGDEGKGTVVDYLCATQDVHAVIRFSGGAQAAHNVVLEDGTHHTFAQFGSGSLRGVPTHLTSDMMVNPLNLMKEAEALPPDALRSLTVSEMALVTTPLHRAVNRAQERVRGDGRHGSCGEGIGETTRMYLAHRDEALRMGDLRDFNVTLNKLTKLYWHYRAEYTPDIFADEPSVTETARWFWEIAQDVNIVSGSWTSVIVAGGPCVFEGSQGVLLDQRYGFHPHTTWSNVTFENATRWLSARDAVKIGVVRSYMTRHGAGPMPTEDPELAATLPEAHNGYGEHQGAWRIGELDLPLLKYAADACGGVDELAVTHMDRAIGRRPVVRHTLRAMPVAARADERNHDYIERIGQQLMLESPAEHVSPIGSDDELVSVIERSLNAPVKTLSYGPTASDKKMLETV